MSLDGQEELLECEAAHTKNLHITQHCQMNIKRKQVDVVFYNII